MLSTERRSLLSAPAPRRSDQRPRPVGAERSPHRQRALSPVWWLAVGSLPILAVAWAGVAFGQAQAPLTVQATVLGSCTVNAGMLDFGSYDAGQADHLDASTTITVNCPEGAAIAINMSAGGGLNGGARGMARDGGGLLTYNLYTAPGGNPADIWGDGSSIGTPLTITHFEAGATNQTVFGRVPGGQDVPPGVYSDQVTISIDLGT